MHPVLAGRNREVIEGLAGELGLEHRVFSLDDPANIRAGIDSMNAVLHAAGPYSATARPMAEACLEVGAHYLDITGEIAVFELLHGYDERAKKAGIVLLPGVGFDVVPTDCAAARVAEMIDQPTRLEIAFHHPGSTSPGTTKTMIEGMARPGQERKNSVIVPVRPGSITRTIPFSDKKRHALCIPWGDVSTAFYSTGIPNIRTYVALPPGRAKAVKRLDTLRPIVRLAPVQKLLKWWVTKSVHGPKTDELETGLARIWCEATNDRGDSEHVEMTTPHGYRLTADTAVTAIQTLLGDSYDGPPSGALTPSMAFGWNFVDKMHGVEWVANSSTT